MKSKGKPNLLFVCSKNKWRSRTAERVFSNDERFSVLSAGTHKSATVTINLKLIDWSDEILVMEHKHKKFILDNFRAKTNLLIIKVLDIPDDFQFMDAALVELLIEKVSALQ